MLPYILAMLNKKIFSNSATHELMSLWAEAMNVWEHYAASQLDMKSAGMMNYAKKWSSKSQPKLVSQDGIATIQGVEEQVPLAWQPADQCLLYGLEKPADVISEVLNFSKFAWIISCFAAHAQTYDASTILCLTKAGSAALDIMHICLQTEMQLSHKG